MSNNGNGSCSECGAYCKEPTKVGCPKYVHIASPTTDNQYFCSWCNGTGEVDGEVCNDCGGAGVT